jgi:iron complex transport system substrate-binding protein
MRRVLFPAFLLLLIGWITPADALEFTDSLGRTVTLPDTIDHVLPAGPPAAIAIYTVAPGKLLGWAKPLTPEQLAFIAEPYRDRPVTGRLTGKEGSIGAAEVKALHPDLIIDVGDLDPQYRALADKIQSETGIPYIVLDGSLATLPELYGQLKPLLDGGLRGDMLSLLTASTLEHVAEQKRSALRPARLYFARDRSGNAAHGMSELDPSLLEALGAISIAGKQAVTPGQIADRNPDIILTANAKIAQQIRKDPAWRDIPAVAQGKVYVVPSLPFGWLGSPPGPNRLIGLEWLSSLLYPEQPQRDLGADIRAFYRDYYQVNLTDAQLQTLLAPEQGSE